MEVAYGRFKRFHRLLTHWDKQASPYIGFGQLVAVLIVYRNVRDV